MLAKGAGPLNVPVRSLKEMRGILRGANTEKTTVIVRIVFDGLCRGYLRLDRMADGWCLAAEFEPQLENLSDVCPDRYPVRALQMGPSVDGGGSCSGGAALTEQGNVVPLHTAISSPRRPIFALQYGLSFADAVIYATRATFGGGVGDGR